MVSVSGKVRRPGLVEVPAGARVADALAAAGGAAARHRPDPAQPGPPGHRRRAGGGRGAGGVRTRRRRPPGPAGSPGAAPGGRPESLPVGQIDLNAATAEQLDGLPGVGPVTAQRILDWRTRNGRFAQVEQLREIEGIGERRFGQLRELVTV